MALVQGDIKTANLIASGVVNDVGAFSRMQDAYHNLIEKAKHAGSQAMDMLTTTINNFVSNETYEQAQEVAFAASAYTDDGRTPLTYTYDTVRTANLYNQHLIMASPFLQHYASKDLIHGFEETYKPIIEYDEIEENPYYQMLMDGVYSEHSVDPDKEIIFYTSSLIECDHIVQEIPDMFKERVFDNWDLTKAMVKEGVDPTIGYEYLD